MAKRLQSPIEQPDQSLLGGTGKAVDGFFSWIKTNWFWALIFFLVVTVIVLVIYLKRRLDEEVDPHQDYLERVVKQCVENSDPRINSVVKINDRGDIRTMGEYIGECYTNDGFFNIRYRTKKFKSKLFDPIYKTPIISIFAEIFMYNKHLLRLNENKKWKEPKKNSRGEVVLDEEGKVKEYEEHELTTNLWQKNSTGQVIIRILDVQKQGYFEYPILRDKDGNIVDMSYEVYSKMSSPIYFELMVSQTKRYATQMNREVNLSKEYVVKQNLGNENISSEDLKGDAKK